MKGLTKQQRRILIWLTRYQRENYTTPSYAEMGEAFGISANTIKLHIHSLHRKKFIHREPRKSRSIIVLKPGE